MHAAAGERIEVDRKRRDQRLAFAGFHLRDPAFVQDHAADQLDVEMALAKRTLGSLPAGREGLHQDVVERLAVGDLFLELIGARPQRRVGQGLKLLLQRVDLSHARHVAPDAALIGGAKKLPGDRANHPRVPFAEGRWPKLADFPGARTPPDRLRWPCSSRRVPTVLSSSGLLSASRFLNAPERARNSASESASSPCSSALISATRG